MSTIEEREGEGAESLLLCWMAELQGEGESTRDDLEVIAETIPRARHTWEVISILNLRCDLRGFPFLLFI